ncbi:MAG: hypothetical protein HAW67_02885, partial [Endozoicomonadaceae bacterium]|nr:hypothetical protein [Endozoicomonadaceae bacterium]
MRPPSSTASMQPVSESLLKKTTDQLAQRKTWKYRLIKRGKEFFYQLIPSALLKKTSSLYKKSLSEMRLVKDQALNDSLASIEQDAAALDAIADASLASDSENLQTIVAFKKAKEISYSIRQVSSRLTTQVIQYHADKKYNIMKNEAILLYLSSLIKQTKSVYSLKMIQNQLPILIATGVMSQAIAKKITNQLRTALTELLPAKLDDLKSSKASSEEQLSDCQKLADTITQIKPTLWFFVDTSNNEIITKVIQHRIIHAFREHKEELVNKIRKDEINERHPETCKVARKHLQNLVKEYCTGPRSDHKTPVFLQTITSLFFKNRAGLACFNKTIKRIIDPILSKLKEKESIASTLIQHSNQKKHNIQFRDASYQQLKHQEKELENDLTFYKNVKLTLENAKEEKSLSKKDHEELYDKNVSDTVNVTLRLEEVKAEIQKKKDRIENFREDLLSYLKHNTIDGIELLDIQQPYLSQVEHVMHMPNLSLKDFEQMEEDHAELKSLEKENSLTDDLENRRVELMAIVSKQTERLQYIRSGNEHYDSILAKVRGKCEFPVQISQHLSASMNNQLNYVLLATCIKEAREKQGVSIDKLDDEPSEQTIKQFIALTSKMTAILSTPFTASSDQSVDQMWQDSDIEKILSNLSHLTNSIDIETLLDLYGYHFKAYYHEMNQNENHHLDEDIEFSVLAEVSSDCAEFHKSQSLLDKAGMASQKFRWPYSAVLRNTLYDSIEQLSQTKEGEVLTEDSVLKERMMNFKLLYTCLTKDQANTEVSIFLKNNPEVHHNMMSLQIQTYTNLICQYQLKHADALKIIDSLQNMAIHQAINDESTFQAIFFEVFNTQLLEEKKHQGEILLAAKLSTINEDILTDDAKCELQQECYQELFISLEKQDRSLERKILAQFDKLGLDATREDIFDIVSTLKSFKEDRTSDQLMQVKQQQFIDQLPETPSVSESADNSSTNLDPTVSQTNSLQSKATVLWNQESKMILEKKAAEWCDHFQLPAESTMHALQYIATLHEKHISVEVKAKQIQSDADHQQQLTLLLTEFSALLSQYTLDYNQAMLPAFIDYLSNSNPILTEDSFQWVCAQYADYIEKMTIDKEVVGLVFADVIKNSKTENELKSGILVQGTQLVIEQKILDTNGLFLEDLILPTVEPSSENGKIDDIIALYNEQLVQGKQQSADLILNLIIGYSVFVQQFKSSAITEEMFYQITANTLEHITQLKNETVENEHSSMSNFERLERGARLVIETQMQAVDLTDSLLIDQLVLPPLTTPEKYGDINNIIQLYNEKLQQGKQYSANAILNLIIEYNVFMQQYQDDMWVMTDDEFH